MTNASTNGNQGQDPTEKRNQQFQDTVMDIETNPLYIPPVSLDTDLGNYTRRNVTNLENPKGRAYFDLGLRHLLSYQHEIASHCFLACLTYSPDCAFAHSLVALCHSPNYNFKGGAYYESTYRPDEAKRDDRWCVFPSQQVADRHSQLALQKIDEIRTKLGKVAGKRKKGDPQRGTDGHMVALPDMIGDVEVQMIAACRILTCHPGISSSESDPLVGRPYANAMRQVYLLYPDDAEVAYFLVEALMVLNAWRLYEYPTGRPLSEDVMETRDVLEAALAKQKDHAGLCHLYVHLSEMSSDPGKALQYCGPLRQDFPQAGHLIHMPTHIDVLVGDYEAVIRWNYAAILADDLSIISSPETAGTTSFYFGYCVHNYHMLVYGCILGGYESKAMEVAHKLNCILTEETFASHRNLVSYLESYSALEVHVMVRFGRWSEILQLHPPQDNHLMFFRAATIKFARCLAHANLGDIEEAKREADRFDSLRAHPLGGERILHNNQVSDLLAVDAPMLRGEIAYRKGDYNEAFRLLRKAVDLQDNLNYDEPWGKMQPIRHALGGLLLEQGRVSEAEEVFRRDLKFHPRNPWGLRGLIQCFESQGNTDFMEQVETISLTTEISILREQLIKQRETEWADFDVTVACECCRK